MADSQAFEMALAALADQAERARSARPDWSIPPNLPVWTPKRLAVFAADQLHHGESATATVCESLLPQMECAAARRCLEAQIDDERRHASFYARYLEALGASAGDTRPALADAYAAIVAWDGPPEAPILATHAVIEVENLKLQRRVSLWLPCPLFRSIADAVARDEARHVAFGNRYLRQRLPALSSAERARIEKWLLDLWSEAIEDVFAGFMPLLGPTPLARPIPGLLAGWRSRSRKRVQASVRRLGL